MTPDTAEEIQRAIYLLGLWTGRAWQVSLSAESEENIQFSETQLAEKGKQLLEQDPKFVEELEIVGEGIVPGKRQGKIVKIVPGYNAYRDMLHLYSVQTVAEYIYSENKSIEEIDAEAEPAEDFSWRNIGGFLLSSDACERVIRSIASGKIGTWEDVHRMYTHESGMYRRNNVIHALKLLSFLTGTTLRTCGHKTWYEFLRKAVAIKEYTLSKSLQSREKDFSSPFRSITFDSEEEKAAVYSGEGDEAVFEQLKEETEEFKTVVNAIINPGASGHTVGST